MARRRGRSRRRACWSAISSQPRELLRRLVDEVAGSRLRFDRRFVMHALEMSEGGLSPVEERVLLELAADAGAKRAVAWTGRTLSDDEVRGKIR